ncbi:MAG: METTL5 family protein [Thermoplasmatota archaeon]
MKKKELELRLQDIPPPAQPVASLEQYQTPAGIAADMLYHAAGDIQGYDIVDLGCGTGIFAIGAALLGASRVVGIDIDASLVAIAREQAERFSVDVRFAVADVAAVSMQSDTVIMNPPFGAQHGNRRADRMFLQKALEIAPVVHSLHLTRTAGFIRRLVTSLGGAVTTATSYRFSIKPQFSFHTKRRADFDVTAIRITRQRTRTR